MRGEVLSHPEITEYILCAFDSNNCCNFAKLVSFN